MVATDKSVIITLAVPVFLILILIEYAYGLRVGKNNYRISDTFTSLGLGLISRFPPMLTLVFKVLYLLMWVLNLILTCYQRKVSGRGL